MGKQEQIKGRLVTVTVLCFLLYIFKFKLELTAIFFKYWLIIELIYFINSV